MPIIVNQLEKLHLSKILRPWYELVTRPPTLGLDHSQFLLMYSPVESLVRAETVEHGI